MSDIETHIKLVNNKLQELLKKYAFLQKENQELKQQAMIGEEKEKESEVKINSLNQKVNILQAASGQMNEKEQREFEKRINIYLKEIDKCISMLSE